MQEELTVLDVLLDAIDEGPDKVMVVCLVDDELTYRGNMTYMESLGAMELVKHSLLNEED